MVKAALLGAVAALCGFFGWWFTLGPGGGRPSITAEPVDAGLAAANEKLRHLCGLELATANSAADAAPDASPAAGPSHAAAPQGQGGGEGQGQESYRESLPLGRS